MNSNKFYVVIIQTSLSQIRKFRCAAKLSDLHTKQICPGVYYDCVLWNDSNQIIVISLIAYKQIY